MILIKKNKEKKCTYIAIIGKTNIGKSTLFNKLIKKKISITSKKKYTTQKNIIGIYTKKNNQYIYVDTPGYNENKNLEPYIYINKLKNFFFKKFYNKKINLLILMIEKKLHLYELKLIKLINILKIPILLIINKIDKLKNKNILLHLIKKIKNTGKYTSIVPISSKKIKDINLIKKKIINNYLVKSKHLFKKNKKTDCKDNFIIKEIIREKTIRLIGEEIPYSIKFLIKKIIEKKKIKMIYFVIYVKKKNYVNILIGKNGNKIKKIIFLSKKEIKKYFNIKKKLILFIHIKHKKN